jgi:multidrug efflux pump
MERDADASPILYMAFSSERHSNEEITDFVDRYVTDQVETIPGVAEAQVLGARKYSMRIWLDPALLAAHNVTPQEVEAAIRTQNIEVPGGRMESSAREFMILTDTSLATPAEFENISVRKSGATLVRLKDVGRAGLVSYLEAVDTQRTALQAERQLNLNRGLQMTTSVLLVKALGGGWDVGR